MTIKPNTTETAWLWNDIKKFVFNIPKIDEIDRGKLNAVLALWKDQLSELSAIEKKYQVTSVIEGILHEPALAIQEMTFSLRLIEDLVLSRRVSELALKTIYLKDIGSYGSRQITHKAFQEYIGSRFGDAKIHFSNMCWENFGLPHEVLLIAPSNGSEEYYRINYGPQQDSKVMTLGQMESLQNFIGRVKRDLREQQFVWVILKESPLHYIPVMFTLYGDHQINVFIQDSLVRRIIPTSLEEAAYYKHEATRKNIRGLINSVMGTDAIRGIYEFHRSRQSQNINNMFYVIHDIETTLRLIKKNKLLFGLVDGRCQANAAYFKVKDLVRADDKEGIAQKDIRLVSKDEPGTRGNARLVKIAVNFFRFQIESQAIFVEPTVYGQEDSEGDIQWKVSSEPIEGDCCLIL